MDEVTVTSPVHGEITFSRNTTRGEPDDPKKHPLKMWWPPSDHPLAKTNTLLFYFIEEGEYEFTVSSEAGLPPPFDKPTSVLVGHGGRAPTPQEAFDSLMARAEAGELF